MLSLPPIFSWSYRRGSDSMADSGWREGPVAGLSAFLIHGTIAGRSPWIKAGQRTGGLGPECNAPAKAPCCLPGAPGPGNHPPKGHWTPRAACTRSCAFQRPAGGRIGEETSGKHRGQSQRTERGKG